MRDIRKRGALSIFPIFLAVMATPAVAAIASNPPVTFAGPSATLVLADAPPISPLADRQRLAAADLLHAGETSASQLPQSAEESNDVIRHRGFRKFLVIALICGGLIRILTSPSYLRFITDALDPKAF